MHRRAAVSSCILVLLLASLFAAPAHAQAPAAGPADPAALQREATAARLDLGRAVAVKNVKLAAGLGVLFLDDGVVVPSTTVGGKTIEMVFLGSGRITVEPPDEIEAGQLDLFTGSPRLEEEVTEISLILGMNAAVEALLRRPKATLDAAQTERCQEIWKTWKERPERRLLGVDTAVLLNAAGDPAYQGYFAARFGGAIQSAGRATGTSGSARPWRTTPRSSSAATGSSPTLSPGRGSSPPRLSVKAGSPSPGRA